MANLTEQNNPSSSTVLNGIMSGMSIDGNIHSDTDIVIRGKLNGDLVCKAKVIIDKTGIVAGNINAKDVLVEGVVKGNLNTSSHTYISETGTIQGKIHTKKLVVEDGASFAKIEFV